MDRRDRQLACALLRREVHRTGRYHNWRSVHGTEQGQVIRSRGEVSVILHYQHMWKQENCNRK